MTKTYKSEALGAVHEMIEGLFEAGAVDKITMRDFDKSCLAEIRALRPDEIKSIRDGENVSQSVFARYLNVSANLISDWERGLKKPGGPALRLLAVVRKSGLEALV
ncbi:MAG: putative transcriptional regulator [Hyphomonadaceae bacterium]|nr:MAG: putative transcriptional regulator [Hyphomonadaceae bacterium]